VKAGIVLLPGDGIGPEIIEQARKVLDAVAIEGVPLVSRDEVLDTFGATRIW
jgi:isocitrate/isopropylmalate dehydrogenase